MKTKHFNKFVLPIVLLATLILSACGAQVQSPIVFPTATAPIQAVVTASASTANCAGSYGDEKFDLKSGDEKFVVRVDREVKFACNDGQVTITDSKAAPECPREVGTTFTFYNDLSGSCTWASGSATWLAPAPVVWTQSSVPTTSDGITAATGEFQTGWTSDWYWSPFRTTTDALTDETTRETFAEPGVLLDNTAAFDHMSAAETPILVPEGGYSYIAIGAISLAHEGKKLSLYHQKGNIYLIIVRGLPADGTDADLNQIVMASDYVRGAGIYSPMPAGAYVSLGWFEQQIQNSYDDPNCGREGCKKVTIVVVDMQTHTFRSWVTINPSDLRDWVRVP